MKNKKVMALMALSVVLLIGGCGTKTDGQAESSVSVGSSAAESSAEFQQKTEFIAVEVNSDFSAVLGETSIVSVKAEDSGNDVTQTVTIVSGDAQEVIGEFGSVASIYVAKNAEGKSFVFVTCDYMSNDFVLFVYDVTAGQLVKCDELSGALEGEISTMKTLMVSERLDVLGTYYGSCGYSLDANGKLTDKSEIYKIDSEAELKLIKDLPAVLENGGSVLTAGNSIKVTGVYGDTVFFVVVGTEETGYIQYTVDEEEPWIHNIDGISEYEYFEMLPYSG